MLWSEPARFQSLHITAAPTSQSVLFLYRNSHLFFLFFHLPNASPFLSSPPIWQQEKTKGTKLSSHIKYFPLSFNFKVSRKVQTCLIIGISSYEHSWSFLLCPWWVSIQTLYAFMVCSWFGKHHKNRDGSVFQPLDSVYKTVLNLN